jgi:hypothetical protein
MTTPAPAPVGSFTSGRSLHHSKAARRHYSGQKTCPHRIRLGCGYGFAEPGQPHRLLIDPERGQCVVCESCYVADVAEAAPRAHQPEDGQPPERVLPADPAALTVKPQSAERGGLDPDRNEDWLTA